jgi:hypothetical protein
MFYQEATANTADFLILLVFFKTVDAGKVPYTALTASWMALPGTVVLRRVFLNVISSMVLFAPLMR